MPKNAKTTSDVIPQNVSVFNPCSVAVRRIPTPQKVTSTSTASTLKAPGYDMCARPTPKKTTHRTSGRKHPKVDYLQYDASEDLPSPPRKRRSVDLKRHLSVGRIAAEKYKTKPLNLPRPVRKGCTVTTQLQRVQQYNSTTQHCEHIIKYGHNYETSFPKRN